MSILAALMLLQNMPATPSQIVAAAPLSEWRTIPDRDLLVMDLAPDRGGGKRRVVIQLVPAPISTGWVENIRRLAAAHWWDGLAVVRVQDNYVVQWGDPTEKKPLPADMMAVPESAYVTSLDALAEARPDIDREEQARLSDIGRRAIRGTSTPNAPMGWHERDSYSRWVEMHNGWPLATDDQSGWVPHCYGMVGVGRNMSPDTGSGAELYTVIGQAPRHLDRNIAVVGRVIEGMAHLSSLKRGTADLGFYKTPAERTAIRRVRVASDLPPAERPSFEYLSTESESFAAYAAARANRKDDFFIRPAGAVDICNLPVPVRPVKR